MALLSYPFELELIAKSYLHQLLTTHTLFHDDLSLSQASNSIPPFASDYLIYLSILKAMLQKSKDKHVREAGRLFYTVTFSKPLPEM
ncbi:hypothetical protein PMEGAPR236_07240 [Priestia megaterium]